MTRILLEHRFRAGRAGLYAIYVLGAPAGDGTSCWHGWIEFVPLADGVLLRTPRETTQPNWKCVAYWAGGLTPVYLEGAYRRAIGAGPSRRHARSGDHEARLDLTAEDRRLLKSLGIAAASADRPWP